jgi:hypothetical protein
MTRYKVPTPKKQKKMAENAEKTPKVATWKKIIAVPALIGMILMWAIDRLIHIMLPHVKHPNLKGYLMEKTSLAMTAMRILIFAIPVIIYNLIF